VDGDIAVEVRRLNRNIHADTPETCGPEVTQFALRNCFRWLLRSLGSPIDDHCWFVRYTFSRPIPSLSIVRRDVGRILASFKNGELQDRTFPITDHFHVDLIPSTEAFPQCFVLGGYVDKDATGWLVPDLMKNIRTCIDEKTRPYRHIVSGASTRRRGL
jgi:hypothetical protein